MLPSILGAPTLVALAGRPRLARPLSLGDLATLLRAAGDAVGRDADGPEPPRFADPDVVDWLDGPGLGLLAWCALRRDRPRLSIAAAARLAATASADEASSLVAAAFRRRPRPRDDDEARPTGSDPSSVDWAAVVYRYFEEGGRLPGEVADLTLDQADAIAARGRGADEASEANRAALQRAWEASRAAAEAAREAAPPDAAPVTLADLGYAVAPGEGDPGAAREGGDS